MMLVFNATATGMMIDAYLRNVISVTTSEDVGLKPFKTLIAMVPNSIWEVARNAAVS